MKFAQGSCVPYWQGAEKGWEAGEGGELERTWYVHWVEDCNRWMVYSFVAGEAASSSSGPILSTAFTETAEEGKEIAEMAHEEAWNKEKQRAHAEAWEAMATEIVNKLLE